jgi:hypothetical protein
VTRRHDLLPDDWRATPLISREVRFEADGTPWIGQADPVMPERIREVYCKLCESWETGRQIVAVSQEVTTALHALIEKKKRRVAGATRRSKKPGRNARCRVAAGQRFQLRRADGQFSTTEMAAFDAVSSGVITRNRWPSDEAA